MRIQDLQNEAVILRNKLADVEDEIKAEKAYLALNDLYLDIQAKRTKLTKSIYWELYRLLYGFEKNGSAMFIWWESEFRRLPGWLNV